MPRRPRIHLAGVPLHIVQRGHNRDACFFADDDFHAYRHWLGEALKESGCTLHAYVFMTNHVHLLLTPPQPEDVPRLIISLGRRYVQYINKTYRRKSKGPGSIKLGYTWPHHAPPPPYTFGRCAAAHCPARTQPRCLLFR
ncbi:MAG: transposase [Betaproteobacteria bacterium]|nr:transposase [Betaproteobacteria bacterium]